MSKKISKVLITLTATGAAVGAGIAYFNKYKKEHWEDDFEDFEDKLDEDKEGEQTDVSREYVTIPISGEESKDPVVDTSEDTSEPDKNISDNEIPRTSADNAEKGSE